MRRMTQPLWEESRDLAVAEAWRFEIYPRRDLDRIPELQRSGRARAWLSKPAD